MIFMWIAFLPFMVSKDFRLPLEEAFCQEGICPEPTSVVLCCVVCVCVCVCVSRRSIENDETVCKLFDQEIHTDHTRVIPFRWLWVRPLVLY